MTRIREEEEVCTSLNTVRPKTLYAQGRFYVGAGGRGTCPQMLAIKPEHLAHWAMAAVGDIGLKVQYKLAHVKYTPARA